MSVNLKKIKVGDTVVYQNGNMCKVTYIRELDNPIRDLSFLYFTVATYNETLEQHRARTHNEVGHVVVDGELDKGFSASQADEWDIVRHIPVESSEETPMDATKIKVGDKVRLRNGEVETVTKIGLTDCDIYPVDVFCGSDEISYTQDGFYWHDREPDHRDILEIIPAESSEETPVDVTTIKVGDEVRLRNGQVKTVTKVVPTNSPAFSVYVYWEGDECSYTRDGLFYGDEKDPRDILEIIPAETSEKPTQDEMTMRDQFAMSALNGLLSNHQCAAFSFSFDPESVAKHSYNIADKMMKAREENNQ